MAGDEGYGGVLDGGISRARFLKLAGLGAGLSLFPGSLFSAGPGMAQAAGVPDILMADARYPILAWCPPPPVPDTGTREEQQTGTNALYAALAGAGFNAVLGGNGVANDGANRLALEACEANNVRLVLADQKLRNAIVGTAPAASQGGEEPQSALQAITEQDSPKDLQAQAAAEPETVSQRIQHLYTEFGNHPALAGLLLYDEPRRSQFGILRDAKNEVEQQFGGDELPYVNVWPSYASPKNALGAESYADYLEKYMNEVRYQSAVAPPVLSFDHYPLLTDERTTPDFFYNHAVIRRFALRFGVPSWGFVQSMGFDGRNLGLGVRREPDEPEIFWQINVALAYGVKGIQYFTYWTPKNNEVKFGNALITREGAQTEFYDYATRANDFLGKVGGVLLPLTSYSVTHFGEKRLPRGAKAFKGDSYIVAASGAPAILGSFSDPTAPTDRYVLVVNRSLNRASSTRLTISGTVNSVERFDPSAGETGEGGFVLQTLAGDPPRFLTASLEAGMAVLYRLRNAG